MAGFHVQEISEELQIEKTFGNIYFVVILICKSVISLEYKQTMGQYSEKYYDRIITKLGELSVLL